jgi:hypothetical protein
MIWIQVVDNTEYPAPLDTFIYWGGFFIRNEVPLLFLLSVFLMQKLCLNLFFVWKLMTYV